VRNGYGVTPRQLAMLLVLAALWGASFLFIRVAVPALGPIVLAETRVAIAGGALLVYALAVGARPALRARWRDYLLLGSVNAALPFALLSAAELEVEASLAAVLNAVAPLCGAIVGAVWLGERVTNAAKAGLVLGVAGVTLVVGLSPFTIDLPFVAAVAACLAAAFAYGVGANLVRVRFAGDPPLSMAIGQQLAAAAVLLPLIPVMPVRSAPDAVDIACVLALALASTSVAYLLYFRLLAELGATGGMTVIFVVPVFGVLWGALFLDEAIHLSTIAGGAVILASVWLITRRPAPGPAPSGAAEVTAPARLQSRS
jgi:drug/metabolite transporter (DMT)-like permease